MDYLNLKELVHKSEKEIFEEEKTFRKVFIAFLACLLFLFSLFLTSGILAAIDWANPDFTNKIMNSLMENNPEALDSWIQWEMNNKFSSWVISPFISASVILISGVFFVISLLKSYKQKTFKFLSTFSSFLVGFMAFMAVTNLFWSLIVITNWGSTTLYDFIIISWIAASSTIIIWFFVSRNISLIKRITMISIQREQNANFMSELMKRNGNASSQYQSNNKTTTFGTNKQNTNKENPEVVKYKEKLNKLNEKDLQKIAQKLYIAGSESIEKEELINIILGIKFSNIDNNKEPLKEKSDKKTKEIKVDEYEETLDKD